MFADTHCHLDFDRFDTDRLEVIERATQTGIELIINPGINLASSLQAVELARAYPGFIFAAPGIHPNYTQSAEAGDLERIAQACGKPGVAAIGEIGLDYYRTYSTPAVQRAYLEQLLQLAQEKDLPVILHCRQAADDLVPILISWASALPDHLGIKSQPGVLHAYSESSSVAEALMPYGFYFGIGGPLTYANNRVLHAAVQSLPLERILLETDAPFLTPHPHRGERNESSYIPLIAAELAEMKNLPVEEIGKVTTANARRLFTL